MKQIFPKEIIENVVQSYIPKNKTKSKVIYGMILSIIISAFCSLPFLKIKIYSTSRGVVKPNKERVSIVSINSGKVLFSNLQGNVYVKKGDTLLITENAILDEQIALAKIETDVFSEQSEDLNYLIKNRTINLNSIKTSKYKKEYIQYQEKIAEYNTRIAKMKIDYERYNKLFLKGVIAKSEFEDIKLDYDLVQNSQSQIKRQQLNTWQATLTELESNLRSLGSRTAQHLKNKMEYIVTAPVDGTLINVLGIQRGSLISSGVKLSEISPDSDLLAECYISPLDIGLIQKDNPINFQIDAFNYNQWGFATGKIIAITEDVELVDNQPVFKVRCKINEKHLQLKNGAKGKIGKGMTFNARFELAERTLFQLLYDKVDDWVNPGMNDELAISE